MSSLTGGDYQEVLHTDEHNIQLPNSVVDKFSAHVCSVCSLLIEAEVYELQKLLSENHHSLVHSFLTMSSLPIFFVQKYESSSSLVVDDETMIGQSTRTTNENPSGMCKNHTTKNMFDTTTTTFAYTHRHTYTLNLINNTQTTLKRCITLV